MNRTSLPLLALVAGLSCGLEMAAGGAPQAKDAPSIYLAQTSTAQSSAPAASPAPPPSAPPQTGSNNLEKLAMPIALHPDPLIASILPASVYPLEIVQAARFVKNTNNIAKLDEQPWDDNVKAVARFPALIEQMDSNLAWTVELGQAFLAQPKELMDTIQSLRAKAQKAGTLRSSAQQVVTVTNVVVVTTNVTQVVYVTNQVVQVQPSNPQVVYVPSYPPAVYYPPPAYDPITPLVTFGVGMAWGAVLANNCNWGHGEVDIDIDHNVNIDRPDRPDRPDRTGNRGANSGAAAGRQQKWQPDQGRMRQSGVPASAQTRQSRGWSGASTQPTQRGATGARPSTQPAGAGQRPGGASARPSTSASSSRPSGQQSSANRSSPSASRSSPSANRSSPSRSGNSSAFGGVNSGGGGARSFSSRGSASRGGGGRGGGGGRR